MNVRILTFVFGVTLAAPAHAVGDWWILSFADGQCHAASFMAMKYHSGFLLSPLLLEKAERTAGLSPTVDIERDGTGHVAQVVVKKKTGGESWYFPSTANCEEARRYFTDKGEIGRPGELE